MVWLPPLPVQTGGGLVPRGSRVEVFNEIYWVFILLGTLVGVVVFAYMLQLAYKYRHRAGDDTEADAKVDRPELGEVPTGGGKGGKLFLSLFLSAVIVVSLIAWTFGALLFVEEAPPVSDEDAITVEVEGFQFGWAFIYPNGHSASTLRLPANTAVKFEVTSRDVFHNFGIPELKAKADAIPGQTTETWIITEGPAEYEAVCYELCGSGHSFMRAQVVVMPQAEYQEWYANTTNASSESGANAIGADDSEANALTEVVA